MMNLDKYHGLARALFEENPSAQFLFDASATRIVDANGAAQRLTGFAIRDLVRMPMQTLIRFSGRSSERLAELIAISTRQPIRVRCRLRAIGPSKWLKVSVRLIRLPVQPHPLFLMSLRQVQPSHLRNKPIQEESASELATVSNVVAD